MLLAEPFFASESDNSEIGSAVAVVTSVVAVAFSKLLQYILKFIFSRDIQHKSQCHGSVKFGI